MIHERNDDFIQAQMHSRRRGYTTASLHVKKVGRAEGGGVPENIPNLVKPDASIRKRSGNGKTVDTFCPSLRLSHNDNKQQRQFLEK